MLKFSKDKSGYQLQGNLVYDTVNELLDKGSEVMQTSALTVIIDCQQLTRIDSAGVAVFIRWQRYCDQANKKLQLINLPQQALSLIKANKLDGFFNV
jgi:anti-anti-sigma factor